MGLDATIRRRDDEPLGSIAEVQSVLSRVFPETAFGTTPSGEEKLRIMAERGIAIPDVIRDIFLKQPARHGGVFQCEEFSAEFTFELTPSQQVLKIHVVLRGTTVASESHFARLDREFNWMTSHP